MIIKKEGSTSLVTPLYVNGPLGKSVCHGLTEIKAETFNVGGT